MSTSLVMFVSALSLVAVSAGLLGVFFRDWSYRAKDLAQAAADRDEARRLVAEYKDVLAKVNDIDTQRAVKLVELQNRIESAELKISMIGKGARGSV